MEWSVIEGKGVCLRGLLKSLPSKSLLPPRLECLSPIRLLRLLSFPGERRGATCVADTGTECAAATASTRLCASSITTTLRSSRTPSASRVSWCTRLAYGMITCAVPS